MADNRPKLVYLGTPQLAVPPLQALLDSGLYDIVAVVTQTDKPAGRGNQLTAPPVKELAQTKNIPVFQPASLKGIEKKELLTGSDRNRDLVDFLNANAPIDAFIVVAYGKIIPPALVHFPVKGIINIHMSLLPRWRGAAPIQRAVLHGDTMSGVSIMKIDEGLDTGPIYATKEVPIEDDDDSGALTEKLVQAGAPLLLETLPKILDGSLAAKAQANEGATYAEKLEKADFRLDWTKSAREIQSCIRAASPHPGAFTELEKSLLKIYRARIAPDSSYPASQPGTIVEATKVSLVVSTGSGFLALEELQLPGKKRLSVAEFLKGKAVSVGTRLQT